MKVPVYDTAGRKAKEATLPEQFGSFIRKDLVRKAVVSIWKNRIQPYGVKNKAGMNSSAVFRGTRRGYGRSYNWSTSRLPRLMVRGGRRVGKVVNVPQAVGGPKAHPPKPERVWQVKVNKKERRAGIRSALSACVDRDMVASRGHEVPKKYPFIVVRDFEDISKTKDVEKLLHKLGLGPELGRASRKKIRAGKGKRRGRTYKKAKGPLIVVGENSPVVKAASNIPGVDAVSVENVNAELLAPGAHPGRLTIFTESAINKIKHNKLFV